jgi:hypothetical protein
MVVVADVDVSARVGRHPDGAAELAIARAGAAPLPEEHAVPVELLDAVAAVGDEDVPAAVPVAMLLMPLNCPSPWPLLPHVVRNVPFP